LPEPRKVNPVGSALVSLTDAKRTQPSDSVSSSSASIANNVTISVYDTALERIVKAIDVGLHPSAMALSPNGRRLYVANGNSDSVSVIDTTSDSVESTIDVRPESSAARGSAPNALAVGPDGETLYVANAGNNAIALLQPGQHDPVRGFIPVGWFPTALALTKTGDRLLVGNGYGFGSIAPAASGTAGRSYADRKGEVRSSRCRWNPVS
jgi:YVTN family beta-propeller protein